MCQALVFDLGIVIEQLFIACMITRRIFSNIFAQIIALICRIAASSAELAFVVVCFHNNLRCRLWCEFNTINYVFVVVDDSNDKICRITDHLAHVLFNSVHVPDDYGLVFRRRCHHGSIH